MGNKRSAKPARSIRPTLPYVGLVILALVTVAVCFLAATRTLSA